MLTWRRRLLSIFLRMMLCLGPAGVAFADTIAILVPEAKGGHTEFAEVLQKQLERTAPGVTVRILTAVDDAVAGDVRLVIAVGTAAQQAVSAPALRNGRPPVLAVLTPRSGFERIFERSPRATALYLDQPEERQLALISMLPGHPQGIGVIYSASTSLSLPRLRQAVGRTKSRLVEFPVTAERGVAQAVQEAAAQSEVLLAQPDPAVFNPQTIQNILLTTYRAKVPVLGFSPAYTRAGALLSLHSSVLQLAEQATEMARQMLAGQTPAAQYPKFFEVSVNLQVARSLGIDLPNEQALLQGLRLRESRP